MTLATDIAEVHFDLTGRSIDSKLTSIMSHTNRKLAAALESIETEGAKIAAGTFSSFTLDNIIEANATIGVCYDIAAAIKHRLEDGVADDEIVAGILKYALRRGMLDWKPNSTSNISVEMDLSTKAAWGKFYSDFS